MYTDLKRGQQRRRDHMHARTFADEIQEVLEYIFWRTRDDGIQMFLNKYRTRRDAFICFCSNDVAEAIEWVKTTLAPFLLVHSEYAVKVQGQQMLFSDGNGGLVGLEIRHFDA